MISTNAARISTETHEITRIRGYGEPAGIRLLLEIERAGVDPFTSEQATHAGTPLGFSTGHTMTLLHHLVAGGWLTRIKKGLYAVNDPPTRIPKAHPFAIGTAIAVPSAVSHWSALQYWGLTEQIPIAVTVSSPSRVFPRARDTDAESVRAAWTVAGVRYELIVITKPRFFGVSRVWVSERNWVAIFERERALLDTFQHFHVFGSLSVALEILESHLDDLDVERLGQYAEQLRVTAVVKRVGWALERLGAPSTVLTPLRAYPGRGDSPLDPTRPARGHHNRTWRVIENLDAGR